MSWISRLLGRRPRLSQEHESALAAYRAAPAPDGNVVIDALRLVVVDVETSGLNPSKDRLLAIGAVGVQHGLIGLQDSFETILRQEVSSDNENILVHGIDGTTQRSGCDHPEALARFLAFAGKAPLVGFHSDFDRIAINRAMRSSLGFSPGSIWLDLAAIAPVLYPEHARHAHTLDDWMLVFGIENPARHNALADSLATAQLLLAVLARAVRSGEPRLGELLAASTGRRWLAP